MKQFIRVTLLTVSVLVTSALPASCATPATKLIDGEARPINVDHPPAGVEYGPDTSVAYFRQAGKWYQFRVVVSAEPLKVERIDVLELYWATLKANAAVYSFNPITRKYDQEVNTPAKGSSRLVFYEPAEERGVLKATRSSNGLAGGETGLPGRNSSTIEFEVTPMPLEMKSREGKIILTAKAKASIGLPRDATKHTGRQMTVVTVEREFVAELLRDGRISLAAVE